MSLLIVTPHQTCATPEALRPRAFHYVTSDVQLRNVHDYEVTDTYRMRWRTEC